MASEKKKADDWSVMALRLPKDLHEKLRAIAAANDRTISQEARRAISLHIDKETK